MAEDQVIGAYSRLAAAYDGAENQSSCWAVASRDLWHRLRAPAAGEVVVDVGCGSGATLVHLATTVPAHARLIGIEPADGLRARAVAATAGLPVEVRSGRFEALPLDGGVVDYLYSIMAFHWSTDAAQGVREIDRVLRPGGVADLFFIGRFTGREFIRATTPIFLRYLGPAGLLDAAALRQHLTRDEADALFRGRAPGRRIEVREWYETHHDTLVGHLGWWVRIEGQLVSIAADQRAACEHEIRRALDRLRTPEGIPYTLHMLHVRIGEA